MTGPQIPDRPHTWVKDTPSPNALRHARAGGGGCDGWAPVIRGQCYRWIGRDDDGQWWCFYVYKFGPAHWHGEAQRLVWN